MTTIQNGTGILRGRLARYQQPYVEGDPQGLGLDRPFCNPWLPQISTITLSATADVSDEIVAGQVWEIVLTDPDGVEYETTYTVTADDNTAGTDGAGLAHMATQLAAALEANPELDNIVSATASGAVITLTWLHANAGEWTVSATCTPAAAEAVLTDTVATSQDAGGSNLPMGRFVQYGTPHNDAFEGPPRASLLSSATSVIAGIALRDMTKVRPFDTSTTAVNAYVPGDAVGVRQTGEVAMVNRGSAAAVAGGPVYAVISTSGGQALGQARSDAAGTADVWTLTPSAANDAVYGITVTFPAWNGESAQVYVVPPVTADGSATAAEIVALLAASIATVSALAALVTVSGTNTLILTGNDLGRPFVVSDSAEAGDFTSITHTTTAAAYTRLIPGAYWVRPCPVNAIQALCLVQ
jgi:hypothetical protein